MAKITLECTKCKYRMSRHTSNLSRYCPKCDSMMKQVIHFEDLKIQKAKQDLKSFGLI